MSSTSSAKPTARVRPAAGAAGSTSASAGEPRVTRESEEERELGRLSRLGFSSLAECLLSVPKAYFDYSRPTPIISDDDVGHPRYAVLRLTGMRLFDAAKKPTQYWKGAQRVQLDCRDARGRTVQATVFGNIWPWRDVELDSVIHLYGVVGLWSGQFRLENPQPVPKAYRGRITPVYRGKQGQVSGERLAEAVEHLLDPHDPRRRDAALDEAEVLLLAQAGLRESEFGALTGIADVRSLLLALHRPVSLAQGAAAARAATKLSLESIVRRAAAARQRSPVARSAITVKRDLVDELVAELAFPLTGDQRRCINEIVADLRSAYPMRRLLSGDVGTGKSVTFMVPAAAAYAAGADVAILAPSQLVVEQIARELRETFHGLPVCEVVVGSKLGEGIAVGTTALISAAKKAKRTFDLVIIDEQHKFSVEQKQALAGKHTNVLEASATAIPRTLALVNYGGMDVSVLRECPVKKTIQTRITGPDDLPRILAFVREAAARKAQVAVVYPLVSGKAGSGGRKDDTGLGDVESAGRWWCERFPGRVAVLHGKMDAEQKKAAIEATRNQEVDILVTSLVIEVGVTLPSLKAIVVMHPDRHGLSQLHQLRGRVARKGGNGYMFLHTPGELAPDSVERLQLMVECSDGFTLAERDMDMRGFGDVEDDAEAQTGLSRTLFWGVTLTRAELEAASRRLGIHGDDETRAAASSPRTAERSARYAGATTR